MGKYLDYKVTTWNRIHFKDDADISNIIKNLNTGIIPNDLCDDEFGFDYHESNIQDQDEFITPNENDGQSTIELYDEEGNDLWNNSYESEIQRKKEKKEEQQNIINALEALVHKRFNKKKLEARLSSIFNQKITVEEKSYDDVDDVVDYNYIFNAEGEFCGYGDIYFTKMRIKSCDGRDIYITEVNYEFE